MNTIDEIEKDVVVLSDVQETEVEPDEIPEQTGPPQVRVVKMPNSVEDPLQKNVEFSYEGWVFRVYDVRSRGRKFVQRVGMVKMIDEEEKENVGK